MERPQRPLSLRGGLEGDEERVLGSAAAEVVIQGKRSPRPVRAPDSGYSDALGLGLFSVPPVHPRPDEVRGFEFHSPRERRVGVCMPGLTLPRRLLVVRGPRLLCPGPPTTDGQSVPRRILESPYIERNQVRTVGP